jgi:multidrug resistance efflux pump
MSAVQSAQPPSNSETRAADAAVHHVSLRDRLRPGRLIAPLLAIATVAAIMPSAIIWVEHRRTHSITDDAFVEAHIVNIAPQLVSGRIVRLLERFTNGLRTLSRSEILRARSASE